MDEKLKGTLKELGIDFDEWKAKYNEKEKAFWEFTKEHKLSTAELGQIGCAAAVTGAIEAGMSKEEFLDIISKQYDGTVKLLDSFQESLKATLKEISDVTSAVAHPTSSKSSN